MRRRCTWLLRFALVALSISCLLTVATLGQVAAGQQRLVFATGVLPSVLDPIVFHAGGTIIALDTIFDGLTRFDPKGKLGPGLATSWRMVDNNTWQFNLRQDVKFHNGELFNANAVKFSLDRVLNPATKSPVLGRIRSVARVDIVNEYTVRLITKDPDPLLPSSLPQISIEPPEYFKQVGAEGYARKPIGTGPFKVVQWEPGTQLLTAANPLSWRKPEFLAELLWKTVPDPTTRAAAIRTGAAHLTYDLPSDIIPKLRQEGVRVFSAPAAGVHIVMLNSLFDTPLKEKRVRQALNYAVDKEAIVKELLGGLGRVSDGQQLGQEAFGYNPALKPYPFDPAKAKQLLRDAGYGNGFSIQMNCTSGGYYNDKQNCEAIVGYLQAVGVKADLKINETAVHVQLRYDNKQAPMFYHRWIYFPTLDADQIYQWYLSTYGPTTYKNPEFDKLFNPTRREMDRARREKGLQDVAAFVREDAPVIFLMQPPDVYAVATGVTGFTPRTDGIADFDKVSFK